MYTIIIYVFSRSTNYAIQNDNLCIKSNISWITITVNIIENCTRFCFHFSFVLCFDICKCKICKN